MELLGKIFEGFKPFIQIVEMLNKATSDAISINGLADIHQTHLVYSSILNTNRINLVLVSDEASAHKISADLLSMGIVAPVYPPREFNFYDVDGQSSEYEHSRLSILTDIAQCKLRAVVTCPEAALQYTIPPHILNKFTFFVKSGISLTLDEMLQTLSVAGYSRYDQVDGIGQFSLRGGILDVFPPNFNKPLRIEFWGDQIDTICQFEPSSQRRTSPLESAVIPPVNEVIIPNPADLSSKIRSLASSLDVSQDSSGRAASILIQEAENLETNVTLRARDKFIKWIYPFGPSTLFDYLSPESAIFVCDQRKLTARFSEIEQNFAHDMKEYFFDGVLCADLGAIRQHLDFLVKELSIHPCVFLDSFPLNSHIIPVNRTFSLSTKQLPLWNGSLSALVNDLHDIHKANGRAIIFAGTLKSASSLCKDLIGRGVFCKIVDNFHDIPSSEFTPGCVFILPGSLSAGFSYPNLNIYVISYSQPRSLGHQSINKNKKNFTSSLRNICELHDGDHVVHSLHGIGVFRGIHKVSVQGIKKDYIKIEYAKSDVLYIPVTQLDMVDKYIGPREDAHVRLNKLGSSDWQRAKSRVRSAVKDIAKELMLLYSQRLSAPGHAFPPDNDAQLDFDSHFEHVETSDQLRCIQEIKRDMQRHSPMDRLLCGDVGFGKTEVALRAAFKCISDGKQCAILVPTTILAFQHFQTACQRFQGFPVRIDMISRFRSPKQQSQILARLARGEIDLIIGTHRLVQKDVGFFNLGLVIIDEEQRFGVSQKEKFKGICKNIDVLTLSATPIPRTLNMAMSGIRDMSVLEEAPLDRHPVQTYVLEHSDVVINEAIRKELRRHGQVYYLHNNVETISHIATKIQHEIPEARVAFAHGKMSEHQLSSVWHAVLQHDVDILVCTTIIETGIDVSNVNTLIIENADHMGLSQLHQLRGRVGRSSRRAFAYFTFKRNKSISDISQKRLSAIKEFTEFGSGFKIAMRDLELRGAGNILSGAQHGHMADVGYDMYLRLLGEAIRTEKGEAPSSRELECLVDVQAHAYIPQNYIKNLGHRLDIYRRISDIRSQEDALDVTDELIDRFGEPPAPVCGLIQIALLRNLAAHFGILEIKQLDNKLLIYPHTLDKQFVSSLVSRFGDRVSVNASSIRPFVTFRLTSGSSVTEALRDILTLDLSLS